MKILFSFPKNLLGISLKLSSGIKFIDYQCKVSEGLGEKGKRRKEKEYKTERTFKAFQHYACLQGKHPLLFGQTKQSALLLAIRAHRS